MSTYPKLAYKCGDLGIWVMAPGPNPMAEIRRDDGKVLGPQQQLMSIVAHIDLSEWDEIVEPAPLHKGNLLIAGVSERDIDLLLLEEFMASAAFATWFLEQTGEKPGDPSRLTVTSAQRSVTQSVGESDLVVALSDGKGFEHCLLIEDKIGAGFQPRQAERYRERGLAYQKNGLCKTFSTVLVAPSDYLGTKAHRRGFDAVLSYETILAWFAGQDGLGRRVTYKQALLVSAISKAKYGYQPVADDAVTNFWRSYWALALEMAPDLEMPEPKAKPSRSGFIYFRPGTLPRGVAVVHKLRHGFIDLQFASMGRQLSEIRAEYGPFLAPEMTIERAAKSAVIRQKVPVFDTGRPFEEQANNAKLCLAKAGALLHWYLDLKSRQ